jgi:hypothetical protein
MIYIIIARSGIEGNLVYFPLYSFVFIAEFLFPSISLPLQCVCFSKLARYRWYMVSFPVLWLRWTYIYIKLTN